MEENLKDIERFWSEAMQALKKVAEKDASEATALPTHEPGPAAPEIPVCRMKKIIDHDEHRLAGYK